MESQKKNGKTSAGRAKDTRRRAGAAVVSSISTRYGDEGSMAPKHTRSANPDTEAFGEGLDTDERESRDRDTREPREREPRERVTERREADTAATTAGAPRSDGERADDRDSEGGDDAGHRRRRRRRRRNKRGENENTSPPPRQASAPPAHRSRRPGGGGGGHHRPNGRPQQHDAERDYRGPVDSNAPGQSFDGILELHPTKGYGFLRDTKNNYVAGTNDPFVPASLIEKYKLRGGILIHGEVVGGSKGQGPRLRSVEQVDGRSVEDYMKIKPFDELTAINPFEQIKLETGPTPVTMRVLDLLTPIGKGQRALIVAPPRTGKTMLLQEIAHSVSTNHPEIKLIVLLIDERPEEVTEMQRRVKGEVIASSMDRDVESHVRLSQLIIERAKRLAEAGEHVFILLDSITRTARAFNKWIGNSGRTMTGGLDVKALDIPKKMFGTARRFDEGGSLTVVATALIETESRMDEAIFQEFKGTGNMELVLNRQLADRRIWPALDITKSGTRREELILPPDVLEGVTLLRRSLITLSPIEALEQLTKTLGRFPSNREFLAKIRSIM